MNMERTLAPLERGMEILNRIANSLNIITISKIKGYISQQSLENALTIVQQRHPKLQCCIYGSMKELKIAPKKPDISILFQVLEDKNQDIWQEVVLKELNTGIDSLRSLWRVTLIQQAQKDYSYLITTINHAISDAISTIALHSEILSYCGNKIENLPTSKQLSPLPFLPSPDALFPHTYKGYGGKIQGMMWLLKLTLKQLWLQPKTLEFERLVPVKARSCNFIERKIEPKLTQDLLKRCRMEKTTIQGALGAAMLLAVRAKISTEKTETISTICRSYVDLRKLFNPVIKNENLGILASAVFTFHTIAPNTQFWHLARDVRQKVKLALARGEMFHIISMFEQIFNDLLFNRDRSSLANKPFLTVELSNVGRVEIPVNYGSLELEEISFMPSQAIFGGMFYATATTLNDRILLNLPFSEPALSKKTVEELIELTISNLTNACCLI